MYLVVLLGLIEIAGKKGVVTFHSDNLYHFMTFAQDWDLIFIWTTDKHEVLFGICNRFTQMIDDTCTNTSAMLKKNNKALLIAIL